MDHARGVEPRIFAVSAIGMLHLRISS